MNFIDQQYIALVRGPSAAYSVLLNKAAVGYLSGTLEV